jgi:predicted MFS family arabinose efflux permease
MIDWIGQMYEKLWSRVGGKPWTEIIREEQKKSPLFFLLIFIGLGILVAKLAGKYWWQILIGFLLGMLCGHFWW